MTIQCNPDKLDLEWNTLFQFPNLILITRFKLNANRIASFTFFIQHFKLLIFDRELCSKVLKEALLLFFFLLAGNHEQKMFQAEQKCSPNNIVVFYGLLWIFCGLLSFMSKYQIDRICHLWSYFSEFRLNILQVLWRGIIIYMREIEILLHLQLQVRHLKSKS